jgi:6,7-dimethyl-8-ribityllumazine synthase
MRENGRAALRRQVLPWQLPFFPWPWVLVAERKEKTMYRAQTQSIQTRPSTTRVAFIQARWHSDIVDEARKAFIAVIDALSQGSFAVDVSDAPGAFEIPLMARRIALRGEHAAVIAAGFVVDGGIYRHDFVAATVIDGLMRAQMDADVPVLSVVLTPHHFHNSDEHIRFFREHFKVKGREAAQACMAVIGEVAALELA